jgi:hypothetical protein
LPHACYAAAAAAAAAAQIGSDIRKRGTTSTMASLHLQLRRYQTKLLRLTTGKRSAVCMSSVTGCVCGEGCSSADMAISALFLGTAASALVTAVPASASLRADCLLQHSLMCVQSTSHMFTAGTVVALHALH